MSRRHYCIVLSIAISSIAHGSTNDLLEQYTTGQARSFSAERGALEWITDHPSPNDSAPRSCATCHGKDLREPGRHPKTGKAIEPMAISVTPSRLSDPARVEKWFRRNCRWTMGRECTPQEKGDFVRYINSQ